MAKHDWKIIYSGNSAIERRALEFLYGEMGNYTNDRFVRHSHNSLYYKAFDSAAGYRRTPATASASAESPEPQITTLQHTNTPCRVAPHGVFFIYFFDDGILRQQQTKVAVRASGTVKQDLSVSAE